MTKKLKPCSSCKQEIPENAKFCTKCGAKQVENIEKAEEKLGLKCECGAELLPTAKFCAKCGKKHTQVALVDGEKNICVCGAELVPNAKFCTKCGKKLGVGIPKVNLCTCGAELMANAKFCTKCGQQVGITPVPEMESKKPSKRRRNRLMAAAAVILVLLGATYFLFFFNPGIKKTLLASYEILPNDSTETVISYNDELTISIPPGAITQKDSLHLYSVENIDAPEFADDVLRTYDFDFDKTETFKEEVEVSFSYKNELASNEVATNQSVHVMYYNEETEEWENTDALINKQNNSIRVFRSHFSCLGMVSHASNPGPMMQIYAMNDPATIDYEPDFSKAQDVIKKYSNKKEPDQNDVKDGIGFFMTSFDITSLSTDIHQQLLKFESFAKFNKLAGQVTIIKSAITLGMELGQENYVDAIMNVTKTAVSVGAAAAGIKFVVIYNVAVFLYDLYSDKIEAEADEIDYKNHMADYYHFNANTNPYRKSGAEWTQFIKDNINTSIDFEWMLDQELKKYVSAYFDINSSIPEDVQQSIMQHESIRMRGEIKAAVLRYVQDINAEQEREMTRQMFAMRDELNGIAMIQVMVYGKEEGSKAVRNLPVRIVVDKDQELWSGETDRGGQLMFNCTWLGYFHYEEPKVVEVDYDGKTYTGNIDFSSSNLSIVSIYIDEDADEQPDEDAFSFSSIAGTYSAYCNNHTSFAKDATGQWGEYDDGVEEGCGDHYLEIVVDGNGGVSVIVSSTKSSHCNPIESGTGQFIINEKGISEASINLAYSDDCPNVDATTQKLKNVLINGIYTMEIEYESGVMKVQYSQIIHFIIDVKEILYFDAVK